MTTLVEISKKRLTAEQKAEQKKNQTQARVGLASNVVGLGAGGAGLYAASKVPALRKKSGTVVNTPKYKITPKMRWLAGGALGLQAANIGGDVVANRVLARSAAPTTPVKKSAGTRLGKLVGTGKVVRGDIPKSEVKNLLGASGNARLVENAGGWAVKPGSRLTARTSTPHEISSGVDGATHVKLKSRTGGGLTTKGKVVYVGVPTTAAVGGTAAVVNHKVRKDESITDTYISKADKTTGRGKSFQDMTDDEFEYKVRRATRKERAAGPVSGAVSGGVLGGMTGALVGNPNKGVGRRAAIGAGVGGALMAGGIHAANESKIRQIKRDPIMRYHAEGKLRQYDALKARAMAAKARREGVGKAYRRYDPEADRQRRLGLAAGGGLLGAGVLGQAAAKRVTADVKGSDLKKIKGLAIKPGKGRSAALYSLGAVGSGALGVGAYRRGVSERNNPWN